MSGPYRTQAEPGHFAVRSHTSLLSLSGSWKLPQDLTAGMNRGATENNGIERPPWYTKEWPKETFSGDPFATLILVDDSSAKNPPINRLPPEDCQYNSPGCTLEEMETSNHKSDWLQCASTRIRNLLYCFYLSMISMCFSVYPPHHTMEH